MKWWLWRSRGNGVSDVVVFTVFATVAVVVAATV